MLAKKIFLSFVFMYIWMGYDEQNRDMMVKCVFILNIDFKLSYETGFSKR